MQVFVKRADLVAETPPDPLVVIATYADEPAVPYSAHGGETGDTVTAIYVPQKVVLKKQRTFHGDVVVIETVLDPDWRANAEFIVNAEASRRITEVFPDYKQRNSTATMQQATLAYGNDSTVWPPEAKTFKNEYDRGWTYVSAVRERTTVLIADMPHDPTADSYWATRIDPVSFEPIF